MFIVSYGEATAIAVMALESDDVISQAYDASDCWIFAYTQGGSKRGGSAVMVSKANGILSRFALPDAKNYKRLAGAKMLMPRR